MRERDHVENSKDRTESLAHTPSNEGPPPAYETSSITHTVRRQEKQVAPEVAAQAECHCLLLLSPQLRPRAAEHGAAAQHTERAAGAGSSGVRGRLWCGWIQCPRQALEHCSHLCADHEADLRTKIMNASTDLALMYVRKPTVACLHHMGTSHAASGSSAREGKAPRWSRAG